MGVSPLLLITLMDLLWFFFLFPFFFLGSPYRWHTLAAHIPFLCQFCGASAFIAIVFILSSALVVVSLPFLPCCFFLDVDVSLNSLSRGCGERLVGHLLCDALCDVAIDST